MRIRTFFPMLILTALIFAACTEEGADGLDYLVKSNLVNEDLIVGSGTSYLITVDRGHPEFIIRAYDETNGKVLFSKTVPIGRGSSVTLDVEHNWTGAERTVSLQYSTDGGLTWQTINYGTQPNVFSFRITSDLTDGGTINGTGNSYTVTINGEIYPTLYLRAYDENNDELFGEATVPAGTGEVTKTFTVNKNWTGAERTIRLQFSEDGLTWQTVNYGIQPNAYAVTGNLPGTVPTAGGAYMVTINGDYPELLVRAYDVTNDVEFGTPQTVTAGNTQQSVQFAVPVNAANSQRTVSLEYSRDGGATWVTVNSGAQAGATTVTIHNLAEWEAAVLLANTQGIADFILANKITITSSTPVPAVPMTLSGDTLIIDLSGASPGTYSAGVLQNTATNGEFSFGGDVTLKGSCIEVRNGIMNGANLTLTDGASLDGYGRIVLTGAFTVSGNTSIGGNTVVRCGTFKNSGNLNNSGFVYYSSTQGSGTFAGTGSCGLGSAFQIPNSGFDSWYATTGSNKWWEPGVSGNLKWSSGNEGLATLLKTADKCITLPEESRVISGKAAKMMSQYVSGTILVIITIKKFAAGNIFTGSYSGIAGTSGAYLKFGTPYGQRPIALTGYFDYHSGLINYVKSTLQSSPTEQDSWDIFVALSTKIWDIDTRSLTSYPDLENDSNIIAYGRITSNVSSSGYEPFRVNLNYKNYTTAPTHIMIVATSSRKGDDETGSSTSVLYLDELQLEF